MLQCQFIVDEILESVCALAQDQYGNYVTQVGFLLFGLTLVKFLLSLTLCFSFYLSSYRQLIHF